MERTCNRIRVSGSAVLKGYLIDTGAALLALAAPERLSAKARRAAQRGPATLSVLSYWEVLIKSMSGKLDVGDPHLWWADALDQLNARALPLRAEHIAALSSLPPVHKDPFDRMLIAQALTEGLNLITTDREIAKYSNPQFAVIC